MTTTGTIDTPPKEFEQITHSSHEYLPLTNPQDTIIRVITGEGELSVGDDNRVKLFPEKRVQIPGNTQAGITWGEELVVELIR